MPLDIRTFDPLDLPTGRERADGEDGRLGTATPAGAVKIQSADGNDVISVNEEPDSPIVERAEQKTVTHNYTMSWEAAKTQQDNMPRGAIFYENDDSDPEWTPMYKVLSTRIKHARGGSATLEVVAEQLNGDVPPDQFNIVPVELNFNIMKFPRYYRALKGYTSDEQLLNLGVIRQLQNYMDNPSYAARDAISYRLYQSLGKPGTVTDGIPVPDSSFADPANATGIITPVTGTDFAKYAALEIVSKHWLGIENPYIVGWQITYSQYFWRPQHLHPGGVIQAPYYEVDEQFIISPDIAWADGITNIPEDTIFADMWEKNPQAYLPLEASYEFSSYDYTAISWLRKADQMYFERTFYRVDKTWIGAPVGSWDPDMFNNDINLFPLGVTTGSPPSLLHARGRYANVPMVWPYKPPVYPANPAVP